MSATTRVCTTLTGTEPLLPGGEKLYERQAQVRAVILRRLGEQHGHVLAEPRAHGDRIAWFTAAPGIVRPLSALPAPVRDSVRAECDALLADMGKLGATLEDGASGDGRLAGQLLRMAAKRASDDHLFLVGNQPVLVCWGCEGPDAGALVPVSPPATSEPPAALHQANPEACWLIPLAAAAA